MIAAIVLVIPLIALLMGVIFMRIRTQRQQDSQRVVYALSFPLDLDPGHVKAWVHSISGTLRGRWWGLVGVPSIVFEVWATDRGITYHLHIPWKYADYVIGQLRVTAPGISASPVDAKPLHQWTQIVEVGESNPDRALRIVDPAVLAGSLLGSVQALKQGEEVLIQWVVAPTPPRDGQVEKPQQIRINASLGVRIIESVIGSKVSANTQAAAETREKLAESNVAAILRVATKANTDPRARHLMHNVRGALASVNGANNSFVRTMTPRGYLKKRIARASVPIAWPARLTATELSGLIAWPLGSPHIAGLPRGRTRHMPATEAVPRKGALIGRSTFPGNERPIALSQRHRAQHLHIMGGTGVGKTTLITNLIVHDMKAGHGVVLIDPKGDMFHQALARVPKERAKDVIVVDINDAAYPVGFNPLRDGSVEHAVSQLIKLLETRYPDLRRGGVWAPAGFFRGLTTLAGWKGGAFPDIVPLLSPQWANDQEQQWRQEVMLSAKDENTRTFFQRYLKEPATTQDRYAQPVIDRAWQFNERPIVRNIIGQSRSTFDMADVAAGRRMLFVNLHGDVDEEAAKLLGSMLLNSLYNAAMRRQDKERLNCIYLDEFADLVQLPVSFEEMLAKLRSSNTSLTFAHQDMGQLRKRPDLMSAAMTNGRNKIVFNMSADDARTFANEFRGRVTQDDLVYLGQYEAIARVMTEAGPSDPMTISTFDYTPSLGTADLVRTESRRQFGRKLETVEAEIRGRRQPAEKPGGKRRPARGEQEWKR